jgi:hypothetical protein
MSGMRMPRLEKTDYPSLSMGHSFSKTDISIVGLECQIYGLEEVKKSQKPIVGLVRFLTPQRGRLLMADRNSWEIGFSGKHVEFRFWDLGSFVYVMGGDGA